MRSFDADPLRYLRGVVAGLLGAATLVALGLGLSGVAPRAVLLAVVLWALFGLLTGVIDYVLEPLAELIGRVFSEAGAGSPPAAGQLDLLLQETTRRDPLFQPERVARELKALQRRNELPPADDIRLGLALAELYEQQLHDPGHALGELRRLIDRHPHLRETVRLRELLGVIRAQHFSGMRS